MFQELQPQSRYQFPPNDSPTTTTRPSTITPAGRGGILTSNDVLLLAIEEEINRQEVHDSTAFSPQEDPFSSSITTWTPLATSKLHRKTSRFYSSDT